MALESLEMLWHEIETKAEERGAFWAPRPMGTTQIYRIKGERHRDPSLLSLMLLVFWTEAHELLFFLFCPFSSSLSPPPRPFSLVLQKGVGYRGSSAFPPPCYSPSLGLTSQTSSRLQPPAGSVSRCWLHDYFAMVDQWRHHHLVLSNFLLCISYVQTVLWTPDGNGPTTPGATCMPLQVLINRKRVTSEGAWKPPQTFSPVSLFFTVTRANQWTNGCDQLVEMALILL